MTDYLPKAATIEQACDWLARQTGSAWTLARILECGPKPWFWLDYSTDAPKELFGDKTEGYFAPMIFGGDKHRLEMYGEFALVTMTRTHDDNLIKMTPGMRLDLSEIRFKRESLERVAKIINEQKESQSAASSGAPESAESPAPITLSEGKRGITKAEILDAKWPLPNDAPSLESILDKIPKWVVEACIKVGRAGKGQSGSHLWSPAVLAVCLATRTPHKQWICNQVALTNLIRSQFPDYLDEWTNKREML